MLTDTNHNQAPNRRYRAVVLSLVLLLSCVSVRAGEFSYTGLTAVETAFSTTGDRTLAADAGTAFDNQGRDVNLAAVRLELDTQYRFNRQTQLTGRFRAWGDWVNEIDSAYGDDLDLFAGDDFSGNGALLSSSSDNTIVDIPELYVDYTSGSIWVRIGRQQIAWGDALGMRILDDMISSLDVRRHGGVYGLANEEFLDERIGQNGVRANVRMGQSWELEASVTDFFPTIGYPAGSAYANVPGSLTIVNEDGVREARDEPVLGLRLLGTVLDGSGEVTLAYTRRPQSIAVLRFDPAKDLGPLLSSGAFRVQAEHPRIDTVGGAFSYSFSTDPVGPFAFFNGMIARVEVAYYFNKQYSNPTPATVFAPPGVVAPPGLGPIPLPQPVPFGGNVIEDDELSVGLVIEKNHKFHPDWLSTFLVLQGWYRSASDFNDRHQSLVGEDDWSWLLASVTQPFKNNELSASLNVSYDTGGGWFVQPALTWQPMQRFKLDVFYNWFAGDNDDVYGPLEPNKELAIRVSSFF